MKKRSKAGGEPIKGPRRKTLEPKHRNAPKAARRSNSSPTAELTEIDRLTRELGEALERQTATSEVLNVISSSPGELDPVFNAILQNAARICQAQFGTLNLYDGTVYRTVALHNAPQNFARKRLGETFRPHPDSGLAYVARNKQVVQIDDIRTRQPYSEGDKTVVELADIAGARTLLIVPMLNREKLVGTISIYRQEVRPFTGKQIELVQNFAAQAVIAIENARLLNELRQRTTDLTEALEQQTATSDLLQVISGSPGNLEPVFQAMLENAVGICGANFGNMFLYEDDAFRTVAMFNAPEAYASARMGAPLHPPSDSGLGRLVATKEVVQITDLRTVERYVIKRDPFVVAAVELAGIRTLLAVPMLKEGRLVGAIVIYRQEVRPFGEKQTELVKNFASQVVIAIENARLLNELRQRTTDLTERTADLTEALEQQTATSEVLQVISSSPGDLEPVFSTMLENAVRICGATFGNIYRRDGEAFRIIASHNAPPAFVEALKRYPNISGKRMLATKSPVHVADATTQPFYTEGRDPEVVAAVELGGVRTFLAVPMLKDNDVIGAFLLNRQVVHPFTDKQIELVQSFAAQAVIAIENARLLNELKQSLEQQTATSEVLHVISRSQGDLEPIFANMLDKAVRICDATFGELYRWDGETFQLASMHNTPPQFVEERKRAQFIRPRPDSITGRMLTAKRTAQTTDLAADPLYANERYPSYVAAVELGGVRTVVAVPMIKNDALVGMIMLCRREVRAFSEKQIALVEHFAAEAVIAIENARLLSELREQTDEVTELNQQLEHRVADQVGEIERMSRLRRFLPPQVADLIVASGSEKQLESHRREITALFCDLRGFTGFTESADAEDVMALLRGYHAAIGELVIKYSGTLERYAGDGVMVVFNDPVPVENSALQAVLMALEMRDAIGALTEKWHRWGHDIGFGIGIAHGFATLGTIGFEGRFDYAAIGTVSNVASRLCDEAKPGQILISPRVLTKVENAVKVEPVGEFELKGIRRPLAAYNVVAALASKI